MNEPTENALEAEIADLMRKNNEIVRRIQQERKHLHRVKIELETLLRVRGRVQARLASNGVEASTAPDKPTEAPGAPTPKKPPPSRAVLEFVRANPGARLGAVVAMLENAIATTSPDPKKLLYSVIAQLERRGALRRTGADGHGLTLTDRGLDFDAKPQEANGVP